MSNILRNLIVSGGIVFGTAIAATAADISNLTAGGLQNAASGLSKDETSLTLSGTMNAADFSYIQDTFTNLTDLNLENVTVAAYVGKRLPYTGLTTSDAATLPPYSLTGISTLRSIKLPKGLKAIGKGALSGTGITTINIPDGVTEIGDYAFLRCNSLQSVNVPASVKTIGERAFAYCGDLKTINISEESALAKIPDGMLEASGIQNISLHDLAQCTEIGAWALAECNGLITLVLPAGLTSIGESALSGDSKIQTITLPAELSSLDSNAMAGMTGLKTLYASDIEQVPDLGESVWRNVNQENVTLVTPDSFLADFKAADQWKDFNIIDQSTWETSTDNVINKVGAPEITVSHNDNRLLIKSGTALGRVSVYNVSGHLIASANTDMDNVSIKTDGWVHGVYLIVCNSGIAKISL